MMCGRSIWVVPDRWRAAVYGQNCGHVLITKMTFVFGEINVFNFKKQDRF